MKIPVVGFDPSLTHWGMAQAMLDLKTGVLDRPILSVVRTKPSKHKQVRVNSSDLERAEKLAQHVLAAAKAARAIFVEVPVGSQSARAMCSYGICVGILGAFRANGLQLIEVTATEVKQALAGNPNASKLDMIRMAKNLYPDAVFPNTKEDDEHVADAIGAIHAGVLTPLFQNLLILLNKES